MYGAPGRAPAGVPEKLATHTITRFDFEIDAPHHKEAKTRNIHS